MEPRWNLGRRIGSQQVPQDGKGLPSDSWSADDIHGGCGGFFGGRRREGRGDATGFASGFGGHHGGAAQVRSEAGGREKIRGAGGSEAGGAADATPAFTAVRLPDLVVNGLKDLPADDQVLTRKGEETAAMDEFLGAPHGLDRGVLNRFTLPQLWRKIPVLGVLPFVGTPLQISNEDRAMQMAERADMEELKQLVSIGGAAGKRRS